MSPLVLPVAACFGEGGKSSMLGGAFLYGSSLMFLVLDAVGGVLPLYMRDRPHLLPLLARAGLLAWSVGLWVQALALARQQLPLFFLSFVLLGVGIGVFGLFFMHFELTLRWSADVARCHALMGFVIGFGAIGHTLAFGLLTEYVGVVQTLLLVGGTHTALLALSWWRGFRHEAMFRQSAVMAGDGTPSTPVRELMCSWRLWLLVVVFVGMMFCGMGMKMLLSTLFERALHKTHVESTLFSAFCLCFYWLCRTLTPLIGAGERVFTLFGGVLLVEAFAYGLTPLAIEGQSIWAFTGMRLLSGGGFATLTANITPLTIHMFGERDFAPAMAATAIFEPLAGLGATVAWAMHVTRKEHGTASWALFMYSCAGIAGIATLFVTVLGVDDAKRKRRRRA